MALALRYAVRSDTGLLRDGNEDSGYAGPRLLAVADGMGGHVAGEVASSVAVATLAVLDADAPGGDVLDQLASAVRAANAHLSTMVTADPSLEGMGTTLTAVLRAGSRLGLAHVGDSRCYLLRDGLLSQITRDHTFVQSLVDEGRITAEQAEHHPQRSLLTRALDGRGEVDLDLSVREARVGDRYLLCSDGLSGVVSGATMEETLAEHADPAAACAALVELALRGGGPDTLTCIVADVVDVDEVPSAAPEVVGAAAQTPVADGGPAGRHAESGGAATPASGGGAAAQRAAALRPRPAQAAPDGRSVRQPPAGSRRRRRRWPVLGLLALLLVLGLAGGLVAYRWSQHQYYVGADGDQVAIYQGRSTGLAGPGLSSVLERQDVALDALPPYTRERVFDTIRARDLEDARRIVGRLAAQAEACAPPPPAAPPPALGPQGLPSPQTGAPTPGPTGPPATAVPNPSPAPPSPPATSPPASRPPSGCEEVPL